jgi:hypothetical protein
VATRFFRTFVFKNSKFGFLDCQARQILNLFQSSQDHRFHNAVNILLRALCKNRGGGSGFTDQSFQVSNPLVTEA